MLRLSPLGALYATQFLSAFVDNMILFIIQAIIIRDAYPDFYLPFVQSTFLASYIFLSPWVGRFADRKPKARILKVGNIVKTAGVLLLLLNFSPALSYAVVGLGAVIYSPAKYGMLPFLTQGEDHLLRANSGLESYTILAILAGSVAGGFLADLSIPLALGTCVLLYGASVGTNTLIPEDPGNTAISYRNAIREFIADTATLLSQRQSHYSLLGTGSFWLASAVLRMIIFAWAPLTLGITSGSAISLIIAVTGVGIVIGAAVTPYLVSIRSYQRTVWFGFAMGLSILALLKITSLPAAVIFLLLIGALGGIYIVPMNACLQQVGQRTVGTGKTIAVQNFLENTFMFAGVSAYTVATKTGVATNTCIGVTGMGFLFFVGYLFLSSRKGGTICNV
ncbi:MAG TPA: lysophospholipid transporter LplT [Methylomusa anaerophila]|uniref:Lysophospholipid transporter LplT n=1 Tax=Methylomusa anaerophila TaxID=1930071 RepID=A0A348ALC5_9FIRM|nr:lysophospholipid transporter LplT [Methylomusa anaerophila]BBB91873.1 lysophospholipid transporter LplT [Methylomusa anaerophila]HML88396.1 lysophospholipid transporter LplT [Methylomusa anaerophila]